MPSGFYKKTKEHRKKIGLAHYTKVRVKCETCGKLFDRTKSQVEKYKHYFCGLKCRSEWQKIKEISQSFIDYCKSRTGSKNPNWKNGITPINQKIRHSEEYKLWRKSVFERDKYTCVWCGIKGSEKGGYLHADHIKPFALYPELRFAIDNGRTLCISCHSKTDTYGKNYRYKK